MEENSIVVQDLCKHFKGFTLDHVSFQVPKGRIVGFIGENGAGKSTTIRLILDELRKDGGQVTIFGSDHREVSLKEEIGVVFDTCNFHDVCTAKDVEKILAGVYRNWDGTVFHQYLKRFQIPVDKKIGDFSKGMKMKLSILCAMAHRPKLLILDEATTGLDPVVRDEILDLFLEYIQKEENAIFFSSHITSDIEKIADYVIFIHRGKILFEEQKDDLLDHYGILRCKKEYFASISREDIITYRETPLSMECLVWDREKAKGKYSHAVVDNASLEDIMLFYIKGKEGGEASYERTGL